MLKCLNIWLSEEIRKNRKCIKLVCQSGTSALARDTLNRAPHMSGVVVVVVLVFFQPLLMSVLCLLDASLESDSGDDTCLLVTRLKGSSFGSGWFWFWRAAWVMIVINELFTEKPAPAVVAQGDSVASGRTTTNVKVKSRRDWPESIETEGGSNYPSPSYTSCEWIFPAKIQSNASVMWSVWLLSCQKVKCAENI